MKKLLLSIFAFACLSPFIGNSQTVYKLDSMNNQRTIFSCGSYLLDNKSSYGDYSNNMDV